MENLDNQKKESYRKNRHYYTHSLFSVNTFYVKIH
nr:MAG TPA: hypothetical protein [Caudoviricetes sp.]